MTRAVAALACAVLTACAAPSAAQPVLVDRDFEVLGLSIHLRCGGERQARAPLVVLEAGGGNSADTWRDVHQQIAKFARVCAYDRPGRGTSTKPNQPLAPTAYVQLLDDLLKAAGEPGPFVLVGHSIGGIIAGLFANEHPSDVVGMVLVDSSHEDQIRRFSALSASAAPARAADPATPPPGAPMPEPIPVAALVEELSKKPWRGSIPLVVLTRGRPPSPSPDPNAAARNQIWLELQRDWATRSPKARQIVAQNSGHYIHNDEPALVVEAVRDVLRQAAQ